MVRLRFGLELGMQYMYNIMFTVVDLPGGLGGGFNPL